MHKRCYLVVWKKHWFDWVCMLYCIRRRPNGTPTWPKWRSPTWQGFRRPAEALLQQVRNPHKSRVFKGITLKRVVLFFCFSAILLLVWVYFHSSFMSFPCRAQTTMSCYVTNFESLLKEFSSNDMTKPLKAIIGVANFSVNFPLQRKAAFLHQTSNGKIHCKSFLQPSSS